MLPNFLQCWAVNDEVLSTKGGGQAGLLAVALQHKEHLQGEAEEFFFLKYIFW